MDSIFPSDQAAFQTLGFARPQPKHQQNLAKSLCRDNLPRTDTGTVQETHFVAVSSDCDFHKTSLLSRVGFINRLPWCLLLDHIVDPHFANVLTHWRWSSDCYESWHCDWSSAPLFIPILHLFPHLTTTIHSYSIDWSKVAFLGQVKNSENIVR